MEIKSGLLYPKYPSANYERHVLKNGIQVVLIKTPNVKLSGFGFGVRMGSFDDVLDMPGSSHFLEHCLFLGNELFPSADDLNKLIANNGGDQNASTDDFSMIFHLQIDQSVIPTIIKYFASSCKNPKLTRELIENEAYAVDSEFQAQRENMLFRIQQMIIKKSHDGERRFTCGNFETLVTKPKEMGLDISSIMEEQFNKFICAGNLAVVLSMDDTFENMIKLVENEFGAIPATKQLKDGIGHCPSVPSSTKYFYEGQTLGIYHEMPSSSNVPSLQIVFIQDVKFYKYKVGMKAIIAYMLNDSRNSGFFETLKANGYIHNAGVMFERSGAAILWLQVNLTEKGVRDRLILIKTIMEFIERVHQQLKNPQTWKEIYSTLQKVHQEEFDLDEFSGDIMSNIWTVINNLLSYEPEFALCGEGVFIEENQEAILHLFENFTLEQAIMLYADENWEPAADKAIEEPFFHFKYTEDSLIEVLSGIEPLKLDYKVAGALLYAHMNEELLFLSETSGATPTQYSKTQNSQCWWGGQLDIKTPKKVFSISFRVDQTNSDIATVVGIDLIINIMQEVYSTKYYEYTICNCSFNPRRAYDNFEFTFESSYLADLQVLLDAFLDFSDLDDKLALRVSTLLEKEYVDTEGTYAVVWASRAMEALTFGGQFLRKDRAEYLSKNGSTFEGIKKIIAKAIGSFYVYTYMAGSIDLESSKRITDRLLGRLQNQLTRSTDEMVLQSYTALPRPITLITKNPIVGSLNNAVTIRYIKGNAKFKDRVIMHTIAKFLNTLAFKRLRVDDHLGYYVSCHTSGHATFIYLQCSAEGHTKTPQYMLKALREGIDYLIQYLRDISDEDYEKVTASTLSNMSLRYRSNQTQLLLTVREIVYGTHCFDFNTKMEDHIKLRLKREELGNALQELVKQRYERVHMGVPEEAYNQLQTENQATPIRKVGEMVELANKKQPADDQDSGRLVVHENTLNQVREELLKGPRWTELIPCGDENE